MCIELGNSNGPAGHSVRPLQYLEDQGDLVSRLIMGIIGFLILLTGVIRVGKRIAQKT